MFRHDRALFRVLVDGRPQWAATEAKVDFHGATLHPLLDLPEDALSPKWLEAAQIADLGRPLGAYEFVFQEGRLLPPVDRPQNIVCVTTNYADHAKEPAHDKRGKPAFFSKTSACITTPVAEVSLPGIADNPLADYQVEAAVVVARDIAFGTVLDEAKGREAIAGYCLANDLTWRRMLVEDEGALWRAKNGFRATPVGPALLPRSVADRLRIMRVGALPDLRLRTSVERLGPVQDARTSAMIHPPLALMDAVLQVTELRRGDVILTGTPAGGAFSAVARSGVLGALLGGAGLARLDKSERFLRVGDRVSVSGDYLGHQLTTIAPFVPRPRPTSPSTP